MADAAGAFMPPEGQTEYAFPGAQGGGDEADAAFQRNQQIQSSFDQSRMQRSMLQGVGGALSKTSQQVQQQQQQIDRLERERGAK